MTGRDQYAPGPASGAQTANTPEAAKGDNNKRYKISYAVSPNSDRRRRIENQQISRPDRWLGEKTGPR